MFFQLTPTSLEHISHSTKTFGHKNGKCSQKAPKKLEFEFGEALPQKELQAQFTSHALLQLQCILSIISFFLFEYISQPKPSRRIAENFSALGPWYGRENFWSWVISVFLHHGGWGAALWWGIYSSFILVVILNCFRKLTVLIHTHDRSILMPSRTSTSVTLWS